MPHLSRNRISENLLKRYKTLATKKGRLEEGMFLLEGNRAIQQVMNHHPTQIIEIIATGDRPPEDHHYPVRLATDKQFRSICHTKSPQETMAVVRLPVETYTDRLPKDPGKNILLLEHIQDPGNVGTLIRTAAAFNFSGIILTDQSADPLSPKSVQSTAGSILSVWIRRSSRYLELVTTLKQMGYCLLTADLEGKENASTLCERHPLVLGIGNEASGPSPKLKSLSDYRLKIPIDRNRAESLNVAACGAICMYLSSRY